MIYLKTYHFPKEETNALQELMEEEIAETGSPLAGGEKQRRFRWTPVGELSGTYVNT